MIVDKNKKPSGGLDSTTPGNSTIIEVDNSDTEKVAQYSTEQELYEGNPLTDIYNAISTILKGIKVDDKDPNSPPLFRTVKLNSGQLNRIKHDQHNYQYALAFPAAFVHLINIHWLVKTSRVGEGRAELRVCFVLNRLNIEDDEVQTEGYEVFQKVHNAIEEGKYKFSALSSRCQLTYFDQVENFDDGLQQFWITYEVWFRDYSAYTYKNYVERHLVIPPFTNHSDQLPENNEDNHENHDEPTYDEATSFTDREG